MPVEIERKYLVQNDSWKALATSSRSLRQGYFPTSNGVTVRVRIADDFARLTVKGPVFGISRPEFEYPIPLADAEKMLGMFCGRQLVEKRRWHVPFGGFLWEIDEFHGENEGLVVAEIELHTPDEEFPVPEWIGREVSQEVRFRNSHLLRYPYSKWTDDEKK